ncbi:3-oxoacyl-[acyl-carrier-protein] synthase III C-terminal domain-containing protein [Plantactinospora veratri]|uniref:3-oxoacyl-[acyl-carrier-protein] synthase III C-terminal domain-containing protein n=1 Tax=Plantactinospora veratri TaxID=1436122 RepID=A0ABU7SQZ0_9ACTN
MTALAAVSTFTPSKRAPIGELAQWLGIDDRQLRVFRRFYGLGEVCLHPTGTLADLMLAAAGKLDALRGAEDRVRYVVQARTIEAVEPYPVSALREVCDALGLGHATAFTVTQHGCASGLLAVDLAGRLLAEDGDPDALALVFAGEKAFTPGVQLIPETSVMGEGSAAVLVRHGGPGDRMLSYATRTHGQFHSGLYLAGELAEEFRLRYFEYLAEVILAALHEAGMGLPDLDLVLPHNVNRYSWARVCRHLGFPEDRVLLANVASLGHCYSADPFINYTTAVETGRLQPGNRYLMASVGLGATFSAMVFQH